MTLIAFEYAILQSAKLQTAKDVVREVSKKSQFRKPFLKVRGKWVQRLMNS